MTDAVLCIDIGTSAIKAAVIDGVGQVCSFSRIKLDYSLQSGLWLNCLALAILSLSKNVQNKENLKKIEISSICISGNGPTLVAEKNGGFVHGGSEKLLLWNIPDNQTNLNTTQSLFIPRLRLYRNLFPQNWDESSFIFSGPEYLIYQLTDTPVTILPEERFLSAYWTNDELCANDINSKKLPPFVKPSYCAGSVSSAARKILHLDEVDLTFTSNIKVFCGAPDFITALVGTNTLFPGAICDRAGSSEGINLCTEKPVSCPCVRTLPSICAPYFNASVLIPDSGTKFSKYKKSLPMTDAMTYRDFVNYVLSDKNSIGFDIIFEILGDLKKRYNKLLSCAVHSGVKSVEIITATGGQSRNDAWMQLKASILETPLAVTACLDAELLGDAIFARVGLGEYESVETASKKLVTIDKIFYPDDSNKNQLIDDFVKYFFSHIYDENPCKKDGCCS